MAPAKPTPTEPANSGDASESRLESALDGATIYRDHADFLWRSLQHLGIEDSDLEDVMQEVLVVVHRRRQSFDSTCRQTTWLFAICLRVASQYRRRAHRRWERGADEMPELMSSVTPESQLARHQAVRQLESILAQLTLEQRATFLMFEIEGQSCQEIADLFAVPIGTVYSRLHTARASIQEQLERERRPRVKAGRP